MGPWCRSSAGVDHRPSRWFGIRCFCPFLPSCFPYGHSGLCENLQKTGLAPKRWTDEVTFREKIMKQLKSQRRHSKAFRKEAVELLLTGRTLGELAEQLQVPVATLHNCKQEYLMDLEHQAPDVAGLP